MATGRLLVAYSNPATFTATTMEYLRSFKHYSAYQTRYLHVTHGAEIDVDLNEFDAVLNSYCARLCFPGYVSQSYIDALKRFRGVRLLAVQDEYDRSNSVRQAIRDIGFHVVLTCVPEESREFVYPKGLFPDTEFITVLTGYVPTDLKNRRTRIPLSQRPITIGYRGRNIGGRYGRLAFEKLEIGRRMRQICEERGIPHDIQMTEETRIYGDAWYDFLGSCRATLGTESGSNVFDFDGSLEAKYLELKTRKGEDPSYEEFRIYTDPLEDHVQMGQISPRVFEAAATHTPMVLFTGKYSNAISPGQHYIELKKDFSNIDAVLGQLSDMNYLEGLADRAHRDLIISGNYGYENFVRKVDDTIERRRGETTIPVTGETAQHRQTWSHRPPTMDLAATAKEVPTSEPREAVFLSYRALLLEYQTVIEEQRRTIDLLSRGLGRVLVHPAKSLALLLGPRREEVLARVVKSLAMRLLGRRLGGIFVRFAKSVVLRLRSGSLRRRQSSAAVSSPGKTK